MPEVIDLSSRRKRGGAPEDAGGADERLSGVRPLGYDHDTYYYLSSLQDQIVTLKASEHSAGNLLRLMDIEAWTVDFPPRPRQSVAFDVLAATNALMARCHAQGPFDPQRIRGRGVWWDDGAAVVHLGRQIWSKGRMWQPAEARLEGIYEAGPAWPGLLGDPFAGGEGEALLDVCRMLRWRRPAIDPLLLAGWIVAALVCGGLKWRPHLWLTAEAGSGKTWVYTEVIGAMLGPVALRLKGSTTEAAARQSLGNDARPTLFDEAEPGDGMTDEEMRMRRVIALLRQLSSDDGSQIVKGGADHKARTFHGVTSACMVSIIVGTINQADEDRFTVLELLAPASATQEDRDGSAAHFDALRQAASVLTPEFARRLFGTAVQHLGTVRHNAEQLASAIARQLGSRRAGDQIGTLLAGSLLLIDPERLSDEQAAAYVAGLDLSMCQRDARATDQEQCLQSIMSKKVNVDTGHGRQKLERTLGQLAETALRRSSGEDLDVSLQDAEMTLGRYGLKAVDGPPDDRDPARQSRLLAIANNHDELKALLKSTRFASGQWRRILIRLEGATPSPDPIRFGPGVQQRATLIPGRYVLK